MVLILVLITLIYKPVDPKERKNEFIDSSCTLKSDLRQTWGNRYDEYKHKEPTEQVSCKWCVIREKINAKNLAQVNSINFRHKNIIDEWGEVHDFTDEQVKFFLWAMNKSIEKDWSETPLLIQYDSTKHKELNLGKHVKDGAILVKVKSGYKPLTNGPKGLNTLSQKLTMGHLEHSLYNPDDGSTKSRYLRNLFSESDPKSSK